MNVWDRKALRQIEAATEQVDIETACRMLIMVLKQKAQFLSNNEKYAIVYIDNKLYRVSHDLMLMLLRTELKSKL